MRVAGLVAMIMIVVRNRRLDEMRGVTSRPAARATAMACDNATGTP